MHQILEVIIILIIRKIKLILKLVGALIIIYNTEATI